MDAASTTPHGPIWRGATVLLVDDEPRMRELLRRMLEAQGVEGAHGDGPEAVTVLHNENPLRRGVQGCGAGGRRTN